MCKLVSPQRSLPWQFEDTNDSKNSEFSQIVPRKWFQFCFKGLNMLI